MIGRPHARTNRCGVCGVGALDVVAAALPHVQPSFTKVPVAAIKCSP